MYKKSTDYMGKHVEYNAIMHACGGIGLGILIMYFLKPQSPLIWASVFIGLAILGHIYVFLKIKA